jgi:threonyl-tRNA synthetase
MNKKNENEYLNSLRHTAAHLLAKSVKELWPGTHNAIGPSIENGFYQDFDFGNVKISDSDLPKIEKRMKENLPSWKKFIFKEVSLIEAKKLFKDNPYKLELAEEFAKGGKKLQTNDPGNFLDLCKMDHIENPSDELQNFRLLSVAGAYWRGDEKNKMLTRIYGTVWPTKTELDNYLNQIKEAEKRNHKKLGQELELFMFSDYSPGMAYWLPSGVLLYNELINYWRVEHQKYGYKEIVTPLINKKELYETSGHWEHYLEDMFISETSEGEVYALKPMNCPNAMVVFGSKTRSYRDLPLRLGDTDTLHRNERSGTLNGLLRIREFRQDDAHIFLSEDLIADEFKQLFEITEKFYSIFGLQYKFRLGTRPEKFMGDKKIWDKAEKELESILQKSGKEFSILEGDGAFYGPKIDILMKDSLGRDWQMGTLQLDFQIPLRFNLKYSAQDGTLKSPVVAHRVIYGSMERFIGILIEHFGGAFPVWLSPVQVKILPISEKQFTYSEKIKTKLMKAGVRVELDDRSETLGAKIRDAQNMKIPYMVIVGQKEVDASKIAVRTREGKDLGQTELDTFIKNLQDKITDKSLDI